MEVHVLITGGGLDTRRHSRLTGSGRKGGAVQLRMFPGHMYMFGQVRGYGERDTLQPIIPEF